MIEDSPAPVAHPGKRYTGAAIDVFFDGPRCIHAAECVRGLPAVFDRSRRPWVLPDAAPAEELADVVERCPTGALHYTRHDGGPAEAPDDANTVGVQAHGPYYVRGRLRVVTAEGTLLIDDVRLALCRCGQSQHKPFCDNAHLAAHFRDEGRLAAAPGTTAGGAAEASPLANPPANADAAAPEHVELSIKVRKNGPLKLQGAFALIGAPDAAGEQSIQRTDDAVLCRCGGSGTKPFCDGTHRVNGFQG